MGPRWSRSRGREYRYYVRTKVGRNGRGACSVRAAPAGTIGDFVVQHIRTTAGDPVMLARVAEILQRRHAERAPALEKELAQLAAEQQRRHAERAPALEKELAQLAAEQQRCRQEGKRVLQTIGGDEARRSGITTQRIADSTSAPANSSCA
jgi:hypothetical protein